MVVVSFVHAEFPLSGVSATLPPLAKIREFLRAFFQGTLDIAAEIGVHPKTVSRALERGGAPEKKRKRRSSKLEPYKSTVDRLLSEGVWNAIVILRKLTTIPGEKGD